jgi:hypothetical protein
MYFSFRVEMIATRKTEPTATPRPMLAEIGRRFMTGRARKVDVQILSPMHAVLLCQLEVEKTRQFIRDRQGDLKDYTVRCVLVTVHRSRPENERGKTWVIPENPEGAIEVADKIKELGGEVLFAGSLFFVFEKSGAVVRWLRPFVVSPEANEILARAAMKFTDVPKERLDA